MKIAFIDYVLEPHKPGQSGLSDVVWDMASELVNQGHEAHIVASYHTRCYPDPRVIVHQFATPPIGYRNLLGQLWILKRAATIMKQIQPDIIHCPEYVSSAVFAACAVPAPLVMTAPGNIFQRLATGHGYDWHYVQFLKWAARTSARRCASILTISQEMQDWWEWTGSPPERIRTIPYGVNVEHFAPVADACARLGIPTDTCMLLYVGRFSQEKGLFDLLAALEQIASHCDPKYVQVVLAGKGPQHDQLQQQISARGLAPLVQIREWITRDDLPTWYSAADALLLPSWNEPLGRVMLEALACGTPVIASASEGPKDHIIHGQNGFLFPPHDVSALAALLTEVVQQPALLAHMRPAALAYARQHITWHTIVTRIVTDVYASLCVNDQRSEIAQGHQQ